MSDAIELKNDQITVHVVEGPNCLIKLDIRVSLQATKAAHEKAAKSVNKEVSLPGFRRGKAPYDLILKHYKKHVDDEWREIVLNTSFTEALDLCKKYPYNNSNSIKKPHIKTLSMDEGAHFSIEFETTPQVPLLKAEDFTLLEATANDITEKDIEDFIEQIRLNAATWEDVKDRPVEEGDYIDLDIESLDQPGVMLCKDTRFHAAQGKMAPWMYKLLIGVYPETSVEGVSEKETHSCTDHSEHCGHDHSADSNFIQTKCRITVKAIKKAELPEVNDEFAKKISGETLEAFHVTARKKLEKDADEERKEKIKEHLKNQIIEKFDFALPKSFIETDDEEEAGELRFSLIINNFATEKHIKVSDSEMKRAMMHEILTKSEIGESILQDDEKEIQKARTSLYFNILTDKALNTLLEEIEAGCSKT